MIVATKTLLFKLPVMVLAKLITKVKVNHNFGNKHIHLTTSQTIGLSVFFFASLKTLGAAHYKTFLVCFIFTEGPCITDSNQI